MRLGSAGGWLEAAIGGAPENSKLTDCVRLLHCPKVHAWIGLGERGRPLSTAKSNSKTNRARPQESYHDTRDAHGKQQASDTPVEEPTITSHLVNLVRRLTAFEKAVSSYN